MMRMALILAFTPTVLAEINEPTSAPEATPPAEKLPARADLRPQFKRWGLLPRSQGSRNTCSVFATTGVLEFACSKHFNRGTRLSAEYLNWACNQVINNRTQDRGQFFRDLLRGFDGYGICMATEMPYSERFDPELEPSPQAAVSAQKIRAVELKVHWINSWHRQPGLTDEQLRKIKQVLAKGYPVAAGASHSRLLVGYADDRREPGGGVFFAQDSAGGKYRAVTYEFVKAKVNDVFWVEAPPKLKSRATDQQESSTRATPRKWRGWSFAKRLSSGGTAHVVRHQVWANYSVADV